MPIRELRDAEWNFSAGRFDEVIKICRELILDDPDCHQAFYLLGRTCKSIGKFDEARGMIEKATRLKADAAPYHTELGNLLAAEGQLDAAADAYKTAVKLSPEFVDPLVSLGATLQLLDRTDEAVAVYTAAVKLVPNAAVLHFNLAEAQAELGFGSLAANGYRRAVELEPEWSELQRKYGLSQLAAGQVEVAQTACRRAVFLMPGEAENHIALARALMAGGDKWDALKVCDTYLASHANNMAVVACRAVVLNDMGFRDAAARLLGFDAFIRMLNISPPAGYGSLSAFNTVLVEEAQQRHVLEYELSLRMVIGGRQSGELFREPTASIALLMEQIDGLVSGYVDGLSETINHRFATRKPRKWRLGGYSIELETNGRLEAHIRTEAWLRGLYLAKAVGRPKVTLGVPPSGWGFSGEPLIQVFRPKPGELLFFPGHIYCSVTLEEGEDCVFYATQIIEE